MRTKIILISIVIFTLCGCNDEFMNRYPTDSLNDLNFWHNEAELISYCNGFYPDMFSGHDLTTNTSPIVSGDNQSDNMAPVGFNQVAAGQHIVPATGGGWTWGIIRRCNYFLVRYDQTPIIQSTKDLYAGEIRFFKCLEYFRLVKRFGDVPWYNKDITDINSPELFAPRDSRILVMDSVLADINWAIEKLPAKSAAVRGRVNRDVALILKARICLHEGTFRKYHGIQGYEKFLREAVNAANTLMTEGNYSLHTTGGPDMAYRNLFCTLNLDNVSEIIYFRKYDEALSVTTQICRYMQDNSSELSATKSLVDSYLCDDGKPISQSPRFLGHDDLYTEMTNRDSRLTQTICCTTFPQFPGGTIDRPTIPGSNGAQGIASCGYQLLKWWSDDMEEYMRSTNGIQDAPIYRFAEALLVYAEAKAELDECDQAALDLSINKLRDRAGMPPMVISELVKDSQSDFPDVPVLIDEIRRERRVELAIEGLRYDDMMRWRAGKLFEKEVLGMKFVQSMYPTVEVGNHITVNGEGFITPYARSIPNGRVFDDTNDKMYYFPLPTEELVLNKNLTQNPGW